MYKSTYEFRSAFIASMLLFVAGTVFGWMGPTMLKLSNEKDGDVNFINRSHTNIIPTIITVTSVCGAILATTVVNIIGRKLTICLTNFPFVLGYLLLLFINHHSMLMFVMALAFLGTGCGMAFVISPMYIAEISEASIRGKLTTYMILQKNVGILSQYALVPLISLKTNAFISIITQIIIVLLTINCLPETPHYLLMKQQDHKANMVLNKLRFNKQQNNDDETTKQTNDRTIQQDSDEEIVDGNKQKFEQVNLMGEKNKMGNEFKTHRMRYNGIINDELRRISEGIEKETSNKSTMNNLFTTYRNAFIVNLIISIMKEFSGMSPISAYLQIILTAANVDNTIIINEIFTPYLGSILMALVNIFSVYLSAMFVDHIGRKILLITSTALLNIPLVTLSIYFYLLNNCEKCDDVGKLQFLTIAMIVLFKLIFSSGLDSIPCIIANESFPVRVKPTAILFINCTCTLMACASINLFHYIKEMFGFHWAFVFLSCGSTCASILYYFFVKETKKQTLEHIQNIYLKS